MRTIASKKEFMGIFRSVFTWVANNKNEFYATIDCTIRTNHEDDDISFDLTVFLDEKPANWTHSNTFITIYQNKSVEQLKDIKSFIKAILKVKSSDEFDKLKTKIENVH